VTIELHANQHENEHEQAKEHYEHDRSRESLVQPAEEIAERGPAPRQLEHSEESDTSQGGQGPLGCLRLLCHSKVHDEFGGRTDYDKRVKPVVPVTEVIAEAEAEKLNYHL